MKRTAMLLVAVLCMMVASSVRATDTSLVFLYQVDNQPADIAEGVHFVVEKNGEVVMDQTLADDQYKLDVTLDPGVYTLSVEQESTEFAGSCKFKVDDVDNAVPGAYDQDPMLFFLTSQGLDYLEGAYECKCIVDGNDCEKNCVCKILKENCTYRICHCDDACCNSAAAAVEPAAPVQCASNGCASCGCSGYGYGGMGWAGLAAIGGLAGAIVALADDDKKPVPPTPIKK